MRNHPRWSRIFAVCAVLTVLVGVASMFVYVELFGHVGIGFGKLAASTTRVNPAPVSWTTIDPRIAWDLRLWVALMPSLWNFVSIPLWMPAVTFATLAWFTRSRAKPRGCCGKCGYNLTGNVSGKCPECGIAVVKDKP